MASPGDLPDFPPKQPKQRERALIRINAAAPASLYQKNDARLGKGFMRVTTALPEDNARVVAALRAELGRSST